MLVTKHFSRKYRKDVLGGQIRFGSLAYYRGLGDETYGRLTDREEGIHHRSYTNTSQSNTELPEFVKQYAGLTDHPSIVLGPGSSLRLRTTIDVYVSCLSKGQFQPERAQRFRDEQDNKDLDSFVTYDLDKLARAVTFEIPKRRVIRKMATVSKILVIAADVSYGEKDHRTALPMLLPDQGNNYARDDFIQAVFRKPEKYQHEQEFRLALHGLNAIPDVPTFEISSFGIKRSIVDSGHF